MYEQFLAEDHRIFGLNGVADGKCKCGNPECEALYKHPVASNWQHTPLWSDDQIEFMIESGQLSTGYGVLVKGLIVVDVDARNGGVKSFEKLAEAIPSIGGCGFVVNTGSGGGSKHLYFRAPADTPLVQHHNDYPGIDFKSSGFVVGPGSRHISGNKYEAVLGEPCDIEEAPKELIELLKKQDMYRVEYDGVSEDIGQDTIEDMLTHISPDVPHDEWIRIGMAIHHATKGDGFHLWDEWSMNGEDYHGRSKMERRWHSLGKSESVASFGTLKYFAEQGGYIEPVTFVSNTEFDYVEPVTEGLPFSIEGIDLLRPPGFVGDVTAWINDQCRYPRENLAVAAAIVAMGNVCGLRYEDGYDGVTANTFAFCVAGSGSGKEAVLTAANDIHRAAGIQGATHGSIKSEQEITRNLIRNQAAFYVIDEIGILLQKIASAQKNGGASYLDGVIGLLMSAYSKANGYMLLTGDMKEEVRAMLVKELAQINKAISENEADERQTRRLPNVKEALAQVDNGLERPYCSLIGFTTPETFNDLVTPESATNGFIARSFLINERETNPKCKRGFKKAPMEDHMRFAIASLYTGGEYDPNQDRVENYGKRVNVPSSDDAKDMLSAALDWLETRAESEKSTSGLEAIVRRGYELMAKISLVLSAPSGLRTGEHVRWAFAFMKRDIEEKIMLASGNRNEKGVDAIASRILSVISDDHSESEGVIVQRCRKFRKEDVLNVLQKMVENDYIELRESKHSANGSTIRKYVAKKR